MTNRRKPRADRRAQIMATAAQLFRERGFDATSIDEIGAAVGISGPAIYSHFKGKQALLDEILLAAIGEFTVGVDAGRVVADPIERLDRVHRSVLDAMLSRNDAVAVYLRERRRLEGASRTSLLHARRNELRSLEALCTARPGLGEAQADLMVTGTTGAFFSLLHYRPQVSSTRLAELLVPAARDAVLSPPLLPSDAVASSERRGGPPHDRASRREQLIEVAADLFRRRSFAGVSVGEIGEAAGIASTGLYRHFASKEDLLRAIFVRAQEQLTSTVNRCLGAGAPPDVLDALVTSLVELAIDQRDLRAVYLTEMHSLGPQQFSAIQRTQREFGEEWRMVYQRVAPELSTEEATVVVQAAIGVVTGYTLGRSRLTPDATKTTLVEMVRAVLASPARSTAAAP